MVAPMALITTEEAAAHLHIDLQYDDSSPPVIDDERLDDLEAKIAEAEATILDYLEMEEADLTATGVSENWLPIAQAAVKLYLSSLYDDRAADGETDYLAQDGAIARLLRRIRYPAIA
jgi:hypothetical protein